jgi:serine/threonine protein phosphatase 1
MKKRWVIPDIHGCVNTLKALIEEQIKPARYDELYFLGDYINCGPESRAVIDYIRFLQKDEYEDGHPVFGADGTEEPGSIPL